MTKLDDVKRRLADRGKVEIALSNPEAEKQITELQSQIKSLYNFLNTKKDYDFDILAKQLVQVNKHLQLQPYFDELAKQLDPKNLKTIDINGFTKLLKAVESNKPHKPLPIDLEPVRKAVVQVEQAVREYSVLEQAPDKYQPVRRVIKVGNRLVFDDSQGGGGSSGGGGGRAFIGRYLTSYPTLNSGDTVDEFPVNVNGFQLVDLATAIAGEDQTNNRMMVEQQMSGLMVIADTQVKSGAGFLHTVNFACNDATPIAGSVIIYDSLTETGTQLFNWAIPAVYFNPFTLTFNSKFATGLYVGFTTTNDVNVTVSYR